MMDADRRRKRRVDWILRFRREFARNKVRLIDLAVWQNGAAMRSSATVDYGFGLKLAEAAVVLSKNRRDRRRSYT